MPRPLSLGRNNPSRLTSYKSTTTRITPKGILYILQNAGLYSNPRTYPIHKKMGGYSKLLDRPYILTPCNALYPESLYLHIVLRNSRKNTPPMVLQIILLLDIPFTCLLQELRRHRDLGTGLVVLPPVPFALAICSMTNFTGNSTKITHQLAMLVSGIKKLASLIISS